MQDFETDVLRIGREFYKRYLSRGFNHDGLFAGVRERVHAKYLAGSIGDLNDKMRLIENQNGEIGRRFVHTKRRDFHLARVCLHDCQLGTVRHALVRHLRQINAVLGHLQPFEDKIAIRIGDSCQCDSLHWTARQRRDRIRAG